MSQALSEGDPPRSQQQERHATQLQRRGRMRVVSLAGVFREKSASAGNESRWLNSLAHAPGVPREATDVCWPVGRALSHGRGRGETRCCCSRCRVDCGCDTPHVHSADRCSTHHHAGALDPSRSRERLGETPRRRGSNRSDETQRGAATQSDYLMVLRQPPSRRPISASLVAACSYCPVVMRVRSCARRR